MTLLVREFAPAKINLALHVLRRRADGYHELDSVVAFASVGDVLEIEPAEATTLVVDGPFAQQVPVTSENLVLKAYAGLSVHYDLPRVKMRLIKNLPVASGIGGGSADAAAAIRGLLKLSGQPHRTDIVRAIALSLGADVPVCLHGKACRMQGVGDVITALDQLHAKAILLVNPLQACGTADVFRAMGLKAGDRLGSSLDLSQPATWRNDMTTAAVSVLPIIAEVLQTLRDIAPSATVRMSGSGATCFAMFETKDDAEAAAKRLQNSNWWIVAAELT